MEDINEKAIRLFKEKILTPVLYIMEYKEKVEFICFCDKNIKMSVLNSVGEELTEILGKPAEIVDIREFSEADRVEVLKTAEPAFSEDAFIERVFISSIAEDYRMAAAEKNNMLNRYKSSGSCYLQ